MILSAICALTFTPAMCALLLDRVEEEHAPRAARAGFSRFNRVFERSRDGYLAAVATMVRHAVLVMLTFAASARRGVLTSFPRATGLVPPEDQGYFARRA